MTSNGGDVGNGFGADSFEGRNAGFLEDTGHPGVKPTRNTYDSFVDTAEQDAFDTLVLQDLAH